MLMNINEHKWLTNKIFLIGVIMRFMVLKALSQLVVETGRESKYVKTCFSSSDTFSPLLYMYRFFTDYKMHFFLRKIASKIQVRLILKINIKMSSV